MQNKSFRLLMPAIFDNLKEKRILFLFKKLNYSYFIFIIFLLFTGCNNTKLDNTVTPYENNLDAPLFDKNKFKESNYRNDSNIHLKLDTGVDISNINDIVWDDDNIIIASNDKHVRVIDSKSGKNIKNFLGYIAKGEQGIVLAIALSSNKKYLAVAGTLGTRDFKEETILVEGIPFNKKYLIKGKEYIRIYDYETGKLINVINDAHTDSIMALEFSKDNKYLVSKSIDKKAKVWNVNKNFSLNFVIDHDEEVLHSFGFIKNIGIQNNDNSTNLIIKNNNKIYLYDIETGNKVNDVEINDSFGIKVFDNLILAYGYDRKKRDCKLIIFDKNLNKLKTINIVYDKNTMGSFLDFSISKNKRHLIMSYQKSFFLNEVSKEGWKYFSHTESELKFYDIDNDFKEINTNSTFKKKDRMKKIYIKDDLLLVLDDNNHIQIIDLNTKNIIKEFNQKIKIISHVKFDENFQIHLKTDYNPDNFFKESMNYKTFSYDKTLNLNDFSINDIKNQKAIYKDKSFYNPSNKLTLKMEKDLEWLALYDKNNKQVMMFDDTTLGSGINAFGFYKNMVFYNFKSDILIRRADGLLLATLSGHTDTITSLSVKENMLISSSLDGTIKIWNLQSIDENPKNLKVDPVIFNYFHQLFKKGLPNILEKETIEILKDRNINAYYPSEKVIYPLLNISITEDNKYIAWTKEGFFDSSKGTEGFIGYHLNQGLNKEAEFIILENMYSTFYRPDLIKKVLNGENLDKYSKNINLKELLKNGFAPEVRILTKNQNTFDSNINIQGLVCPKENGGYDNLSFMINETPILVSNTTRALKIKKKSEERENCFTIEENITLINGKNTIGFKATNKSGNIESNVSTVGINFDDSKLESKIKTKLVGDANNEKVNDLHILAVAINEYKDKDLKLNLAVNDGTKMLEVIQTVAKPLFKNIHIYKLFDNEASKMNIMESFKNIKSERNDVFLLYVAGHGITDKYNGNYYFLPADFINDGRADSLNTQAVGEKDLMLSLSNIKALKSLILLDTCESGGIIDSNMQKTTTNKISKSIGRAILSATSSSELAIEGYKGHGIFSYTLMEALKGKGYYGDDKITVNELADYTEETLPQRTWEIFKHKQTPQRSMYGVNFNLGEF